MSQWPVHSYRSESIIYAIECNIMQCDAMKAMLSNAMEYDGIQCSNKTRCLKRNFVVIIQFVVA